MIGILFWLPAKIITKALEPVNDMLDKLHASTEEHIAEQEEYYSNLGAKVARTLNEAWTHSNGEPVYANEGREN